KPSCRASRSRTSSSYPASTMRAPTAAKLIASTSATSMTALITRAFTSSLSTTSPTRLAAIGPDQLAWVEADLRKVDAQPPVVVFAHRPLFDLYPEWDWTTKDGKDVIAILSRHENVTVFYGHIHQENHHVTGKIAHHSAKSLAFALPAPGSAPKRVP